MTKVTYELLQDLETAVIKQKGNGKFLFFDDHNVFTGHTYMVTGIDFGHKAMNILDIRSELTGQLQYMSVIGPYYDVLMPFNVFDSKDADDIINSILQKGLIKKWEYKTFRYAVRKKETFRSGCTIYHANIVPAGNPLPETFTGEYLEFVSSNSYRIVNK
jgi:hypothetical protein